MTIEAELRDFYVCHGFGEVLGARTRTVPVYTGCMLVPLPNIETRRRFLKYHDLHHLITGYSVGRIGEGEVSAWELGTGSAFQSPILGLMNLIALSTGLVLAPGRMWRAYARGSRSDNLYGAEMRASIDGGRWNDVASLRAKVLEVRYTSPVLPFRAIAFCLYGLVAMIIHAALAVPAVIIRFLTDTMLGASVFQALKPIRRTDLY
jgi:hypothetical protein